MHYIANTLTNHTVIVTKHKGSADNICQAPELRATLSVCHSWGPGSYYYVLLLNALRYYVLLLNALR